MAASWRRFAWSGGKSLRFLFVPPEAAGLLAATEAAARNSDRDEEPLRRWERVAKPELVKALGRAGVDPASIDDAVMHLIEQALEAVCAGTRIERELAWMSTVLTSAWLRSRRPISRGRRARLLATARACAEGRWKAGHDEEEREQLEVAAAHLPKRFSLVIRLYLCGLDTREVRTALCAELAVAQEQARRIEVTAFQRMRSALGALQRGA
jgi:DNA-directed RNA polymerase specialized sigma24 family protein